MLLFILGFRLKCSYWSLITTKFHLNRIPVGSIEVIDLQDEVLLHSLQPLYSDALVCHPGDRSQVVFTANEEKEQLHFIKRGWIPSVSTGLKLTKHENRLLTYVEPNDSGTTTSNTRVILSVSTTKSFTTGLGVPGCT